MITPAQRAENQRRTSPVSSAQEPASIGARTWPLFHSLRIVIGRQRSTPAGLLEVDLRCAREQRNRQERQFQTPHPGAKGVALQRIVMQADAHGPDYPCLGSATSETSADLRDIEEPCTTALALDPPRILPGDCADAWRSVGVRTFGIAALSPVVFMNARRWP